MRRWPLVILLVGCHRVFGVDPGEAVPGDGDAPACCVVDQRCGAAEDEAQCDNLGCAWSTGALCIGSHAECDANVTALACAQHPGCGWDPAGPCGGEHPACDKYTSATSCTPHGCAWTCEGSHDLCSSYTSAVECQLHECQYDVGSCGGQHVACSTFNGMQLACERHACVYEVGACKGTPHDCSADPANGVCSEGGCDAVPPSCHGTPHACTSLNGLCDAHGCTGGTCSGTTHACADHNLFDCDAAGCTLDPEDCAGSAEACSDLDEASCPNHASCAWSPGGGCMPPTTCGGRDLATCTDGCVWRPCPPVP